MAINDPITLEYVESSGGVEGEWVVALGDREWLYNREDGRGFAQDEPVHFRDPDNLVVWLEKHEPDLFARLQFPDDLRELLDEFGASAALVARRRDVGFDKPVTPDGYVQGELFHGDK